MKTITPLKIAATLALILAACASGYAQGSFSAQVTWNASPTPGIAGYRLYRAPCVDAVVSNACTTGTYVLAGSPAASASTYTDAGISAGQSYSYEMTAYCPTGGCSSGPVGESDPSAAYAVAVPLVKVNLAIAGNGTVASAPSGITCSATCSATTFSVGDTIVLTAAPANGYGFSGWGGACSGTSTCTIRLSSAGQYSVSAAFDLLPPPPTPAEAVTNVTLVGSGSVSSSPGGITCPSTCTASFSVPTTVTLTATASTGWTFTGWSGTGGCTGTSTCVLTESSAANYYATATFTQDTPPSNPIVNVSKVGSGTVTSAPAGINCGSTCSYEFTPSSTVVLTAAPGSNYAFSGWSGDCTGAGTCTLPLSSTGTYQEAATFVSVPSAPTTFALTTAISGSGTGTVSSSPVGINCPGACSAGYASGAAVSLTATASTVWPGSRFLNWSGCASSKNASITVTMSANKSCTAAFKINTKQRGH